MNPNTNRSIFTTSQHSIQNEEVIFERTVHQLSNFKGKSLIKQLIQISKESNFGYITFKSAYKKNELKTLENILFRAGFMIKEFDIDEESKGLTLTIMSESAVHAKFASLISSRLAKNANIIIRDIYGVEGVGVYEAEMYDSEVTFIATPTYSNFKETKKADGAISSKSGRSRRKLVPRIVVEVGVTKGEKDLLDTAYIWLDYDKRGTNIDAILLCNVRWEVRPEIDKRGAAKRKLEEIRLEYIDFAMFLREHRTVLHTTRQETYRDFQLNYCSAATVHVTYPAESLFHLEFIQPPHSIYNSSRSESAPAVDGIPNTISIPRKIIDPDLQSGIDDYIAILTKRDIFVICQRGVEEMEDIFGRDAQRV